MNNLLRAAARPLMRNAKTRTIASLLLNRAPYFHFGLVSPATPGFMADARFRKAYERAQATGSWHGHDPVWNCYIACWAATTAMRLPGDFVECGVHRGALATAIVEYTGFGGSGKKFYLLDSFEGVDPEQMSDKEKKLLGSKYVKGQPYYDDCFGEVTKWFSKYPNIELVRGWIPESLKSVGSDKIAFLSIDMNCREPEIAAAAYFWDKMVPGGLILLDDYGWPTHLDQKEGFDKFAADRGVEVLALPTGQGLLMKTLP